MLNNSISVSILCIIDNEHQNIIAKKRWASDPVSVIDVLNLNSMI